MTETMNPVTDKQAAFILKLLDEREGYSDGFADRVRHGIATAEMSKAKASEVITWLLERPRKAGVKSEAAKIDVPAGHYAATIPGSSEPLTFMRVDRPTEGKHAGRTFVKHIVGGHPDYPIRGEARMNALKAIADAGIAEAAVAYAKEFRRCVHCNTQLTDPISRDLCVGPHCRKVHAGSFPIISAVLAVTEA